MVLYETRIVNPLAIRFSQPRIRPHFQDGRLTEDTIREIDLVSLPPGTSKDYSAVLQHPFPEIEIIRWRPRERDIDGKAIEDENGAKVLGEEQWFTFDNRRLYCLQRAALEHWPRPVCVVVHSVRDMPAIRCVLRKFRTTSLGREVDICHRWNTESEEKQSWNWMARLNLWGSCLPSWSMIQCGLVRVPAALRSVISDEQKTWESLQDAYSVEWVLTRTQPTHVDLKSVLYSKHQDAKPGLKLEDSETMPPSSPLTHYSDAHDMPTLSPVTAADMVIFPELYISRDSKRSEFEESEYRAYSTYSPCRDSGYRASLPPVTYASSFDTMHRGDSGYSISDYGTRRHGSSLRQSQQSSAESDFNGKAAGRLLLCLLKDGLDHEVSSTTSTCTGGIK